MMLNHRGLSTKLLVVLMGVVFEVHGSSGAVILLQPLCGSHFHQKLRSRSKVVGTGIAKFCVQ